MDLKSIQKPYDVVIGLGGNCQVAYQLKRLGLRTFATPVDQMLLDEVKMINKAIYNDFRGYASFRNIKLRLDLTESNSANYVVHNPLYDWYSHHDYSKKYPRWLWFLQHPKIQKRFNRRIRNFCRHIEEANSILFVRADDVDRSEDLKELSRMLRKKLKGSFNILAIKYGTKYGEIDIDDDFVCYMEIPHHVINDPWQGKNQVWDEMMNGIRLNSESCNSNEKHYQTVP
ncbi:MAG TPA: DUF1796 family putative cysteine peptidase [Clostridia bacterium]